MTISQVSDVNNSFADFLQYSPVLGMTATQLRALVLMHGLVSNNGCKDHGELIQQTVQLVHDYGQVLLELED